MFDPLENITKNINDVLEKLLNDKSISKKLYKLLFVKNSKIGTIRILPKLHKNKFGIRPIISYKSNPTNNLCILLDLILRPFVEKSESYIKDSQNLIQKCKKKKFPLNTKLFTFDVVSLYTNIEHQKCIDLICEFLIDKIDHFQDLNIVGFREILKLILFNNYFLYEKQYYLQV